MHAPPKPRGPAGFDAFLRIAQRGVPFPTVPAQSLGYHTPGGGWGIDLFASQNFPPSPQIEVAKGLTTSTCLRHKISLHPRKSKWQKGLPPHEKSPHLSHFASQTPPAPVAVFTGKYGSPSTIPTDRK